MTMQEMSRRYQIPEEVLKEYETWNLCSTEGKVSGNWQYDDQDLELLGKVMTLHDIGFEKDEIKRYMRLCLHGGIASAERIRILKQKREQMLDEIHFQEKRLSDLDYLRYEELKERKLEML